MGSLGVKRERQEITSTRQGGIGLGDQLRVRTFFSVSPGGCRSFEHGSHVMRGGFEHWWTTRRGYRYRGRREAEIVVQVMWCISQSYGGPQLWGGGSGGSQWHRR